MPAVITYWQLPADEAAFLNYLTATGNVVAMPDCAVASRQELAPRPIRDYLRQANPDQLVFGLEHHAAAADIESTERDGRTYFCVAHMSPCLIAYSRGRFREVKKLGQSNLAADWTYPDKEVRTLLKKDAAFIKWAKGVLAWVRRHTPEQIVCDGYAYRATKCARQAADRGEIEAVLY